MKQKKAEAMRPIVESYARYEGSKKAFCREHGLAIHTLDYWRRKFSEQPPKTSAFVALEISEPSPGQSIELHYPNGVRAVLPMETSVEILQNLIAAAG
jgi:transposase-like protein